jgi:purine nucleoside phosphorylase
MAGLLPTDFPRVGIICGSGLGALADMVQEAKVLPFAQLPGFPQPGGEFLDNKGREINPNDYLHSCWA